MKDIIKYGIGFDYLPKWGIKEALREIYQNFNDYGAFETKSELKACTDGKHNIITVKQLT